MTDAPAVIINLPAPPAGPQGSPGLPGFTAATRTALTAIATAIVGDPAYLDEAGREGWFKAIATDAASVAADPGQGVYVAGTGVTWRRVLDVAGRYEANWFGVKADGATNDTVAIQRAIDFAAAQGGGRIYLPVGTSSLSSALADTGLSNAQIVLPKVTNYDSTIAIELVGAGVPFSAEAAGGTVWQTTLTGVGNVVGVKTSAGSGASFITLKMTAITIRCPQNSGMTALDLSYVHYSDVNVRCDVPNLGSNSGLALTQPTDQHNCGIRTPVNGVCARCHLNKCVVFGYYFGVRIGELVTGEFIAAACNWAILTQSGSHPSLLTFVLVTNCPNGITANGALGGGDLELNILEYDVEHDTPIASGGSGPTWVSPIGTDVDDPSNQLHGFCNFHMHDTSLPFTVSGAKNWNMREARQNYAVSLDFGNLFSTWTTITNRSSVVDVVTRFGGVPCVSLRQSLNATSGNIGLIPFSNGAGAFTDIRLGQIAVGIDGDKSRGVMTIGTGRDGTVGTAITIPSTNHIVPGVLPNAANDAAAAALSPPVPIGGLYRTGNAVQVRLV
jgi:hypothetical protein